jgi:hypothetical protein
MTAEFLLVSAYRLAKDTVDIPELVDQVGFTPR